MRLLHSPRDGTSGARPQDSGAGRDSGRRHIARAGLASHLLHDGIASAALPLSERILVRRRPFLRPLGVSDRRDSSRPSRRAELLQRLLPPPRLPNPSHLLRLARAFLRHAGRAASVRSRHRLVAFRQRHARACPTRRSRRTSCRRAPERSAPNGCRQPGRWPWRSSSTSSFPSSSASRR